MKQQELISMVYDYLSLLISRVGCKKIRRIVLFGSVARDDFDENSDIDVFVDTDQDIQKEVESATKSFDITKEKNWSIRGIKNPITSICGDLESRKWSDLKDEMNDHGILLYGRMQKETAKENYIVSYDLSGLKQKDKMRIIRTLFGYRTKKDGKVYAHKGIISEDGGERLGQNAFVIPVLSRKKTEKVLAGARFQMRRAAY